MNRIYKVIYSKARQCYIVVSELAKSNHKSSQQGADHTNTPALARIIAVALAAGALTWGSVPGVSWAASESAIVFDDKGSLKSTDAQEITHDLVGYWGLSEGQSIALGKGAHAWMQAGGKAYGMLFGMTKAAGAIAIGEGSEALSQSIDIGNRTYTGAIGDVTISNYSNIGDGSGVGSVLLGTNSYTGGTLSTLIGDYSIISTAYPHGYDGKEGSYLQNAGAVSVGALNSIESATSGSDYSGVANSIVGLANKTNNANGALIYGAGNEITNSNASISTPVPGFGDSAKSAADSLRDSVKENPGGAVLAIGGGNKADWTQRTQIIGVANTVQGSQDKPSIYNMIDGYNTTLNNSSHVYTIGYRNDFNNENNSVVIGDYHQLINGKNNVVIGSYDGSYDEKTKKTTYLTNDKLEDAVILGHNANATVDGGVAIGADSVASTEAGIASFDPKSRKHVNSDKDYSTWVATDAAVSVGGADREVKYKDKEGKDQTQIVKSTRQITNVAAGTQDTDAVNVAQLKAINTNIAASKTHFYSVNSTDAKAKNYNNDGATAANALAAGVGANADKASAVAIGDTAYAGSANGVAIGTGSWIRSSNGNKPNANGGDVAIGQDSYVDSYVNQGGSIALGQNARVENTNGSTERKYAFGQTEFEGDNIPLNPGNEAGGVAIGRNSFARTGSLMVGSHMYKGAIADMDEVDGTDSQKLRDNFNNINMTTLGTNSFNNGTFATVTGSYSATTANPNKKIQNFAATIDGSLNSIESYKYQDKDAADNSGVASSIVGTANRIANSNNTTILGAGNEVTNSLTDITAPTEGGASAKALQDTLKATIQNDAKGAVVISGIGNKVDSSHGVSVLGSKNVVDATDNIQLLGDNREVNGANGSVIIGSADSKTPTSVKDATILGHNATVEKEGGVALGAGSAASIDKDQHGYDFLTKAASASDKKEWKSSWAAVSVGDAEHTRQITNLAAGFNDTDAVNVAQLKNVMNMPVHIYSGGTINTTGTQITNNMTISNLQLDFGDGLKAQEVGNDGDKRVLVTLDKDALKNDPAFKGPKGDAGAQGPKGDKGDTGVQGPKGDKGDAGVQGPKGDKGDAGVQGPKGDKGDAGAQGPKGDKGDTGVQGPKGDKGDAGAQGPKGDKGDTGVQGPKGDKGDAGVQGPKGDKGDTGAQGPKGDKGDTGVQGPKGDKGDAGAQGPKGDKGDTGVQGSKGDKGDTGAQGPKGDKGDTGAQGPKGDKGDAGVQGPKGDKGDTGTQGPKGDKGDTGVQGPKGDKGDTGVQGPKGDKGDTGVQGPKGDKGDTGAQGPKGDKGDTGAQGPAGKDGKDGKDGGVGTVTDDGSNITVTNTETDSTKPANYQVSLKKDINIDSVTADKVTAKEMTTDRLTINKDVSIEKGSKSAVNAGTVYNETRVKQDGKYVKASNTAGENLSVLDNQVASNSSNITNLNGRVNNLDSKVNKVGAGAAALAALHPLDFDPEDKWDFAVGYGNYRDANSVAVGAFYRPDDDTMFSVGTNFGNGENMINAGVSFKFGPKGKSQVRPGSTQEITELRATVARQDDQLKKQDNEIKELKAMVQQLMAKQDKQATTK